MGGRGERQASEEEGMREQEEEIKMEIVSVCVCVCGGLDSLSK